MFRRITASMRLIVPLIAVAIAFGCSSEKKRGVVIQPRYKELPPKQVPEVFKDTILARCDVSNTEPFLVSGYSVAVNLAGTGSSEAPNLVREYIYNEMIKHKWGSSLSGIKLPPPDQALRDPRIAIVQVDGYLPPGVRKGQPFDVQVSALPDSNTSSLAGGELFETDLRIMGANPNDPAGAVNVFGRAEGPIFVNPAYALDPKAAEDPAARRSLRAGVVMGGASSLEDRPLALRLRQPSRRLSRYIEDRIDSRFQEIHPDTIAAAQDEAIIQFYVPYAYQGDYEHFTGVVTHLYLNGSAEFAAMKAKQLADEAVKPDATLMDISYCWEALGKAALPVIAERDLMSHANPDVAYAAARAAAFLGDPAAPEALAKMARVSGNKFQINAIQVLGALPASPAINDLLRPLLSSDQSLVRIAAYKVLAANKDNSILSMPIKTGFVLDVVRSDAPPIIYATQRGEPRIAIIGNVTSLLMPITFSTLNRALTISSDDTMQSVTIFYRPPVPPNGVPRTQLAKVQPVKAQSRPDIAEIIARLGGEGVEGGHGFAFNYGQIVSILNTLISGQQLVALSGGTKVPASLVLQELPAGAESIFNAPAIPDQGRPQTSADEPGRVGMAK